MAATAWVASHDQFDRHPLGGAERAAHSVDGVGRAPVGQLLEAEPRVVMALVFLRRGDVPQVAQLEQRAVGKDPVGIALVVGRTQPGEQRRASGLDFLKLLEAAAEEHPFGVRAVAVGVLQPFADSAVRLASAASAAEEDLREGTGQQGELGAGSAVLPVLRRPDRLVVLRAGGVCPLGLGRSSGRSASVALVLILPRVFPHVLLAPVMPTQLGIRFRQGTVERIEIGGLVRINLCFLLCF